MKKNVLGVIGAIVLGLGYTAFNYFTGAEQGGACSYNDDCKGSLFGKVGAQCLADEVSSYCTNGCATVADCPAGWTCEEVQMTENGIETGETNNVCARPVPGAPAPTGMPPQPDAPAAAPQPVQ